MEFTKKLYPECDKYQYNNPNKSIIYRFNKIMKNYTKFGKIVIGVDFDFTLIDSVTKEVYKDIVQLLERCQRDDITLCIWTANTDREFVEHIWNKNNLKYQHYNYSPINPSSIKPHFNILLDDSAGLDSSIILLELFLMHIENNIDTKI